MYIPEAGAFAAGGTLLLEFDGSFKTPATEDMPAGRIHFAESNVATARADAAISTK